jgi:tetratricopeptide (TPR) repeat protein
MIRQIQLFLGPVRLRALIILFAVTGLISLILNAVVNQYDWVRLVQSGLVLIFIVGAAVIVGGRMRQEERGRWIAILLPSIIAIAIALFIAPQYGAVLVGGALGWIVAALFLTRSPMPMEYKEAIKHLRKYEYAETIKVMDRVINADQKEPNHYRFRAEVYRVWGKLGPAVRDYLTMTKLAPDSPVAYNGLAEVYLQRGEFPQALEAAQKANQLAPDDWVTFYNLGMIEDRLKISDAVVEHLQKALALKVKDARHRMLIHFYLARAYSRLGQTDAAGEQVAAIKRLNAGLEEWKTILDDKQADTLRAVLGDDVEAAQALVNGQLLLADLAAEE